MAVGLYFDAHVDHAIAEQLRRRLVDVLTAQADGADQLSDEQLLVPATQLQRPIITHDIRFKVLAEDWQRQGRMFFGLIFGHLMQVSIGKFVSDLELIAQATDPPDWTGVVVRLPL